MSKKQDQAARIAAKAKVLFCGSLGDQATYEAEQIEKAIRKYGDKRSKEERERCVECVAYSKRATQIVHHAGMCDAIIEAIRKGKA